MGNGRITPYNWIQLNSYQNPKGLTRKVVFRCGGGMSYAGIHLTTWRCNKGFGTLRENLKI